VERLQIATIPFPDDFDPSSGIAVTKSVVAGLDLRSGFISLFDTTMRAVVGKQGRTGNGPQEFLGYAQSEGLRTPPVLWIDARHDTIAAFDGRQIHLWASGRAIGNWALPLSVRSGIRQTSAIRWTSNGIIIGVNRPPGRDEDSDAPGRLELLTLNDRPFDEKAIERFPTLAWPRTSRGFPMRLAAEAAAVWDITGDCAVVADGHTNRFIVTDLRSRLRDTVVAPLPDVFAKEPSADEYLRLGIPVGEIKTRYLARIRGIAIAPTGWLWIRPAAPRAAGEVWRFHLRTGQFLVDTMRYFPVRFDSLGSGFSTHVDDNGGTSLVLFSQK